MSESKLNTYLTAIAEQDVPDSLDLRPAVRQRIERSRQEPNRNAQFQTPRWTQAAAILVLMLLIGTATSLALSPLERVTASEAGIDAIYEAALMQEVNQSQTVGDLTITLEWAYADINRVILAYSVQGEVPEGFRTDARIESLMDRSGTQLELSSERSVIFPGERDTAWMSEALLPSPLQGTDTLDLRVVIGVAGTEVPPLDADDPFTPRTVAQGYSTFDLRVPVTGGHVSEVGHAIEADGVPVTLERVVFSPSMTRAELCFEVPDVEAHAGWAAFGTLSAGWLDRIEGDMSGTHVVGNRFCGTMFFRNQIPLEREHYSLTIREIEGYRRDGGSQSWRIRGPWVFEIDRTR